MRLKKRIVRVRTQLSTQAAVDKRTSFFGFMDRAHKVEGGVEIVTTMDQQATSFQGQ